MAFSKTQNALLWQHWVLGEPLALESAYAPFEAFLSVHTWEQMQGLPMPASEAEACALQHLKALVLGELLSRKLHPQNQAIALLENTLTVMYQAKDFPWYELERLLAHEKNATHRKNLWLEALKTAEPLALAIQNRQQKTAELLQHLGVDEAYATLLFRQVDLGGLSSQIQSRLERTQTHWCAQVEALAKHNGMEEATQADLPFFFQSKLGEGGGHFPAAQQVALVDAVFERLGLWPMPRLMRHWGATQAFPALPLALNGGFEASQLSFTPTPGPNSLKHMLGEMGRALSWTYASQNQWACRHLGPPVLSNASALLFAQLAHNKTWLEEQALPRSLAQAWEKALHAQTEFHFRKTAARFLSQWASRLANHVAPEASKAYLAIHAEVLCIKPLEAEVARLQVDGEEFFAMAEQLRASLLAERIEAFLSKRFGQRWWNEPAAGAWLKSLWQEGNAAPAEFLFEGLSLPTPSSLLAHFMWPS